jgi:hypothetical protein
MVPSWLEGPCDVFKLEDLCNKFTANFMLPEPIPFGDVDPLGASFVPSVKTPDKSGSPSNRKHFN